MQHVEELQHSVSRRSEVRRNTSKKPGVPKNAVKKSTSGWSQLRLAATVFRPFGGIGDAMKQRNSKEEEEERTKAEEEASEERKEAERLQEEEAQRQASRSANFDMCLSLSKQYLTPLEEVRRVFEEFKQMDTSGDLLISEAEFEASARSNLSWPEDQELPDHLQRKLRRYFKDMDKDNSEYIDFPEFFDWSLRNRWTEEFLARDDKDLENRNRPRDLPALFCQLHERFPSHESNDRMVAM
ncbi:unnamed protein product [Effrenium voratum]|nr:unnamed protein product [Effrenium voratum]